MTDRSGKLDIGLLIAAILMLGVGIVLVYSSSFAVARQKFGGADFFLARQLVRAAIGIVCFIVLINIDYHVWGKFAMPVFGLSIVLLIVVLVLPGNHAINGAKRWLPLGFFSFQVSELARIALILVLAERVGKLGGMIKEWSHLLKELGKIAVISLLIVLEPNFSNAMIIGIIGLMMLFIGGARVWHISALLLSLVPIGTLAVLQAPYRRRRLMGFLSGSNVKETIGYQTYQSIVGLGHGGIFGVGLGKSEQKFLFLPEPHTDFIFSILGEEVGFVGLLFVLGVLGFMIYRGIQIAIHAPDRTGQLIAAGLTLSMALNAIVHVCVNTGLIPTTGIPFPFLSYGGMSLIFTMASIGILLNISTQTVAVPVMEIGGAAKPRQNHRSINERVVLNQSIVRD